MNLKTTDANVTQRSSQMNRRELLMGASVLGFATAGARAGPALAGKGEDIPIGVLYPMSGANAQIGVDARHAIETAADIVNNAYDLDLLTAKNARLPGLGNAQIKLIFSHPHPAPQHAPPPAARPYTPATVF